jgi:hypothetical protein
LLRKNEIPNNARALQLQACENEIQQTSNNVTHEITERKVADDSQLFPLEAKRTMPERAEKPLRSKRGELAILQNLAMLSSRMQSTCN